MTSTRQAVLLSGSLGMGHDVAAEACATSLRRHGWSTETLDAMQMLGRRNAGLGKATYRGMLATPGLYDAIYFSALRTGSQPAGLMDWSSRRRLAPVLRAYLDRKPADLAISVFATGASVISSLAGRYPQMAHAVICTDATPHRLWVHPHVDLYLVTSGTAEAAVRRFQPEARVLVIPGPVRAAFYQPPTQEAARTRLGVPPGERCVLLMTGGWGLGPVATVADGLASAGVHVLAVSGHNAKLEQRFRVLARSQHRVHPFGFTEAIPELMAAADLVVTSSGSDTCIEARTIGRPLLLLDIVQGHGRDNLQHELELGDAAVTSARTGDVVRNTLAALDRAKPAQHGVARSLADWEAAFLSALAAIGV